MSFVVHDDPDKRVERMAGAVLNSPGQIYLDQSTDIIRRPSLAKRVDHELMDRATKHRSG